jgi:hypothetical protein
MREALFASAYKLRRISGWGNQSYFSVTQEPLKPSSILVSFLKFSLNEKLSMSTTPGIHPPDETAGYHRKTD